MPTCLYRKELFGVQTDFMYRNPTENSDINV